MAEVSKRDVLADADAYRERIIKGDFQDPARSAAEKLQINERMHDASENVRKKNAAVENEKESALDFSERLKRSLKADLDIIDNGSSEQLFLDSYVNVLAASITKNYWSSKRKDIAQRTILNMVHDINFSIKARSLLKKVLNQLEDQDVQARNSEEAV
ncbi:MAG: hypothetical protein JWO40_787 [Candidatus Doudnabacteria bacterium]|nr:hypothetical protein [Candidatus Doudnabacteria bacterium]